MMNPANSKSVLDSDDPPYDFIKMRGKRVSYDGLMDDDYRTPVYSVDVYPATLSNRLKPTED